MSDRWHFIDIKQNNPLNQHIEAKCNTKTTVQPIEVHPHHKMRHNVDAKNPPKHSLDPNILKSILDEQCECKTSCFLNFSVIDLISIRKQFDYSQYGENTENEIYVALLNYLGSHSVLEKTTDCHQIGEKIYRLTFTCHPGVDVCPTAFCRIIGVSVKKLRIAAQHNSEYGTDLVDTIPNDRVNHSPKADNIISFLQHVSLILAHKVKSERKDGSTFEYDSIIGFHEHKDVFNFYLSMLEDNVEPPSYDWFRKVWSVHFPLLYTSKDRPCITCNEFTHNIKEYTSKRDVASSVAERKRMELHIGIHFPLL